jgi:hypothetical protein
LELLNFSVKAGGIMFHLGYSTETAQNIHLEFVPAGETVQQWSQIITSITTKPGHRLAPDQWISNTIGMLQKTCGKLTLLEKRAGTETDTFRQQQGLPAEYQTFSILAICENPTVAPDPNVTLRHFEVIWFKGIKGWLNDYMIQRAWHGDVIPPNSILASRDVLNEWRDWIEAVTIAGRPKAADTPGH